MLLYTLVCAMCSFIAFLSHTKCQASRISLGRHVDDLSMISTFFQIYSVTVNNMVLANKEFSSNVAKAFACSFTRVFSARDV